MSALKKNGETYDPRYIKAVNAENCIGCGRCYKVCGQEVFNLVERADLDMDDDDYEDEGAMVMSVANDGNCIGCEACSRVCPKNCHEFERAA
ncbi:MAG: ferredoxin III, nif-specific [Candidatus Lambdaproteobacteria bacterium RIFOXYD12_FULL_49_8]|uniref:Ferredoxin III n=1 Tax=Candidatus Lambdaproteobacteria bacterium RIFOXYD2_FULL_50_16 TaxID=1817772 RepID=A0A1F6G8R7_9PROT|nr:MAG: ferredoxin III, nif-specific [Candidatus Lambdaproteobacteria bacterium RIFOXYD2_FULL_50_16]OGG97342.1 MAG: ferredoxin III, nif-specific [Candidatus Lambdaproteobacteria bacterium RIFOXYD12_FULL_49_8]